MSGLKALFSKEGFARFRDKKFTTAYIAKIAILTAAAFLLYNLKFNIPAIFPGFLEIQISELPALLAGYSMGPLSGCLVVIFKCLLKFPLSSTVFVGEATDIILGIAFVLPASLIYHIKKDKKHALLGLCAGTLFLTSCAIVVNRYISVPFYVELFFKGDFSALVGSLRLLYKESTVDSFYKFYLLLGVLPFNLLRCTIVGILTFLLYKKLSGILHWNGHSLKKNTLSGKYVAYSVKGTYALAKRVADKLVGGETVLLNGELGAGKTTFTKGLAAALGIASEVTSPTFTILNVYEDGRLPLYHLDMYRAESMDEVYELGVEEYLNADGVAVIEWNRFEHLTGRIISVKITADGKKRTFFIEDNAEIVEDGNSLAEVDDLTCNIEDVDGLDEFVDDTANSADDTANSTDDTADSMGKSVGSNKTSAVSNDESDKNESLDCMHDDNQ